MAKEAVDRILEAERNGEKLENDALTKAAEIVSDAEAEAAALIEKSRASAEDEAEKLIFSAEEEARKITQDAESDRDAQSYLYSLLENKREDAINAVIKILKE